MRGPTAYVRCVSCSRLLSTDERELNVGVPVQQAAKHLRAHRLGLVKRLT